MITFPECSWEVLKHKVSDTRNKMFPSFQHGIEVHNLKTVFLLQCFAHPKISLKQTYFNWMPVSNKTEGELSHDMWHNNEFLHICEH